MKKYNPYFTVGKKLIGIKFNFINVNGIEREMTIILESQDVGKWKEFVELLASKGARIEHEEYS